MAVYSIKNNLLFLDGKQVPFKKSPNIGGVMKPSLLVMHYTGALSASSAINTLINPAYKVSAHLVLGMDGAVTQLVPFNVVAWHAGKSAWKKKSNVNSFSIGIEMVNPGLLGRNGKGGYFARLENKLVDAKLVQLAKHKNGGGEEPWHIYPSAQIEAAIEIARVICETYKISEIVGHDDIAPGRKTDPGPAWPMTSFVSRALPR